MISFQKYIPIPSTQNPDTVLKGSLLYIDDEPPKVPYYLVEIRVLKHETRYSIERERGSETISGH